MSKGTVLITGAARGIGRGIAIALAERGYDIAANDLNADPKNVETGLYEVKQRVEAFGQRCLPVVGDISEVGEHPRMVAAVLDAFGSIDVLVNNAGVAPKERLDVLDTTEESYDRLLGVNLRGPFFLTQAVARQMVKQVEAGASRSPIIVFITSISADAASPGRAEYCISKAGLAMTAQNFAVRLAQYGINVYDLRPGIIATDMTAVVKERYDKLIAAGLLLQKRWGTPEDVGKAVLALAEGYLDYSTGAVIEVGGGFGVRRL